MILKNKTATIIIQEIIVMKVPKVKETCVQKYTIIDNIPTSIPT